MDPSTPPKNPRPPGEPPVDPPPEDSKSSPGPAVGPPPTDPPPEAGPPVAETKVPRIRHKLDTFTRNIVREARQARHGGRRSGFGLALALTFYGLTLSVSLGVLLWAPTNLNWLRIVDGVVVTLGAVGLATTWRDNRQCLAAPQLTVPLVLLFVAAEIGLLAICAFGAQFVELGERLILAEYRRQGMSLWLALVDFALLPAIGEELLFRIVILTALLEVFGERTAVLVSAFMFATLHLSPFSLVHLSLAGILLAVVRLRTGSIYPCMVLHGAYNAVIIIYFWYFWRTP